MVLNDLLILNNWNSLPDEVKQDVRQFEYLFELLEKMLNLFEWDNLPETIPDWLLEKCLLVYGKAGVDEIDGNLYVGFGTFDGIFNKSGMSEKLRINFVDGTTSEIDIKDGAYGFNTKTAYPDRIFLERYANIFAEIDLSILLNVIYSRNLPIPVTENDIERKQWEELLKRVKKGETVVATSDIMKKFLEGQNSTADILKLFDVSTAQYSQDLNLLHEEMLKRFCNECGIDISVRDKKAQMNTDELNAYDDYSRITIDDKLYQRQLFAERINAKYGTNISVKFKSFIEDNNVNEDGEEVEEDGAGEDNQMEKDPSYDTSNNG